MQPSDLLETILRGTEHDLDSAWQQVSASRGKGDKSLVARVERAVAENPSATISFDATGNATVSGAGRQFAGGRFSVPSIESLKASVAKQDTGKRSAVRFSVIEGTSPITDIGALQAMASEATLFQAASQFNCLEAPGPFLVDVNSYLTDPTQGPRASVSAFPATLVRHYAAPDGSGGRFVQSHDRQINLLADALPPAIGLVNSGYLQVSGIPDLPVAAAALEANFERIRIGVHDDAQVVLGHAWDGGVEGQPHIAQTFTSTLAAGGYGRGEPIRGAVETICQQLLRAAYLGTLLAALDLGKRRVVLTMIGGGVFGNPHRLICESALWAVDEIERLACGSLEVVLNSRDLARDVDRAWLKDACQRRGGVFRILS